MAYLRFHPDLLDVGGVDCWVPGIGCSGELGFELSAWLALRRWPAPLRRPAAARHIGDRD
jgi:hypothetical protein